MSLFYITIYHLLHIQRNLRSRRKKRDNPFQMSPYQEACTYIKIGDDQDGFKILYIDEAIGNLNNLLFKLSPDLLIGLCE